MGSMLILVAIIYYIKERKYIFTLLYTLTLILAVSALVMTQGRGAWLGFIVALFVVLFFLFRNKTPPPKGERPNGSLSQWSVTSFGFGRNFAGFGKRLCAYSKKSLWCGARRDGWSRPLPLGAPRPMIFK